MSDRISKKLRRERDGATAGFVCPCPVCGGHHDNYGISYKDGTAIVDKIEIFCNQCGSSIIKFHEDERMYRVASDGAPYLPESDDIAATEYHRFKAADYETEEDALRAESDLIDRCMEIYDENDLDDDWLFDRQKELFERAYSIGMKDFIVMQVTDMILYAIEDGADVKTVVDKCIEMIQDIPLEDRCMLTAFTLTAGKQCSEVKKITEDQVKHILWELENFEGDDNERIAMMSLAYCTLQEIDPPKAGEILQKAIIIAKAMPDKKEGERNLILLYSYDAIKLGEGERLEEEINLIGRHVEEFPTTCAMAVHHYCRLMMPHADRHGRILKLADKMIESLTMAQEEETEAIEWSIDGDLARFYEIRYLIGKNAKDLSEAAACACLSLMDRKDEEIEALLDRCLNDPRMPKKEKKEIERNRKLMELIENEGERPWRQRCRPSFD